MNINHDEAEVVLSAKTYWHYGSDVSGVRFPLSLFKTHTEAGLSGFPSFLLSPFIGPVQLNLFNVRIPFILINLVTGVLLSLVIFILTKEVLFSSITFFIFLINPWSFLFSRATTEAPLALLLVVASIYSFLCVKNRFRYLSVIFLSLAFFSYFGLKPLVPFIALALYILYPIVLKRSALRLGIKFFVVIIFIFLSYIIISKNIPESTLNKRSAEVSILNLNRFGSQVNDLRRSSINFPGNRLFVNKFTLFVGDVAEKYVSSFSPDFLFANGDPRATYRLGGHGNLYYLDFPLILIGLIALYETSADLLFITLSLLLIAPIGAVLSDVEKSYMFRASLMMPAFIILISSAIFYLYDKSKGFVKNLTIPIFITIYMILFLNFIRFFFFQYSVTQQENQFLSERVLVNYLMRSKSKVIVVTSSPLQIYQQYEFYSNNVSNKFPNNLNHINFGNVELVNKCVSPESKVIYIVQAKMNCKITNLPYVSIQDEKDAGEIYKIFNDNLCVGATLDKYRRVNMINDYSIENMSINEFCNRWINFSN